MKLENKTAVVTGGGSGMGLAIAEALADEGCGVLIAGRSQQRLEEALSNASSKERITAQQADIADRDSVAQLFTKAAEVLGQVDILVNSAGINVPDRSMEKLSPENWDKILQVNATGNFNLMQAVLPAMRERKDGLIVNISSIAGLRGDLRGGVAYAAAKFAQAGLGMTVGAEVAADGVRVTNIYPGETNTPILDKRPVPVSDEHRASILQSEDVAATVLMVALLPARARVPELTITPTCQPFV